MNQKLCNVTIVFSDGQSAVINNLNEDQTQQLSAVLEASSVWYQWRGDYPQLRREQSPTWWQRISAWIMPLLLVTLLSASAMAQQALQPVRVSVASDSEATDVDKEFNSLLREHLGRLNAVRFTSARFDCKVLTASTPITEAGRLTGYAAAVATLTPGGDSARDLRLQLHIETGPNLSELARKMTAYLQREIFPTIEKRK